MDIRSVSRSLVLGADLNRGGNQTPLYMAALNGHKECVKVLVEGGTDVNKQSSLIHIYALCGWKDQMEAAIRQGGDVNVGDSQGRAPAYIAATHSIDNKANPCLKILLHEYDAIFLSTKAGKLTEREKHIRLVEFVIVGGVLGGSAYYYLTVASSSSGSHLTTSTGSTAACSCSHICLILSRCSPSRCFSSFSRSCSRQV